MRFKKIFNYVSKFTKWIKGDYKVKSFVDGRLYPIPINLTTLESLWCKIKSKMKFKFY